MDEEVRKEIDELIRQLDVLKAEVFKLRVDKQ